MHNRFSATLAALTLAVAPVSVFADVTVTEDLGTLDSGTIQLNGTTVGKTNNAWAWSGFNNAGTTVWGNGEHVYQFTLTKSAFLMLENATEPDADGFPDPNNDYILTNTLTTFDSNNTAVTTNNNPTFTDFNGLPEGTSLAIITETFGSSTPGSSAQANTFRHATNNPTGIWGPGTYFLAVDSRSGTVNSHGQSNGMPPGAFTAQFKVLYTDEVVAPSAVAAQAGGQITGSYGPGEVKFFSFVYDGGAMTIDTEGNDLPGNSDTFLVLYDSQGVVVTLNDDVLPQAWSRISIADGQLNLGETYYLGFTEYKAVANPGFDLYVYPDAVGASGTFVINGLSEVPEPSSLALLALTPLLLRRRR